MKSLALFLLAALPVVTTAQKSCCSMNSTQQFSMLAMNEEFVASHAAPEPFTYSDGKGEMVSYKCSDGANASGYLLHSAKPSSKYLFVIHEWWGLNDYIKREADRYSAELGPEINVIALDLYDGKVAETPIVAQELMSSVKDDRARAIINGAISFAGTKARIYTIGWCFGGGWSLQAALLAENQAAGCVMYYGMPEKDLTKLKNLNADVLGIFAAKDQWINGEVVKQFQTDMVKAGKTLKVKTYDADHAFANPSNPKFNKVATEDARKNALAFLKAHLK